MSISGGRRNGSVCLSVSCFFCFSLGGGGGGEGRETPPFFVGRCFQGKKTPRGPTRRDNPRESLRRKLAPSAHSTSSRAAADRDPHSHSPRTSGVSKLNQGSAGLVLGSIYQGSQNWEPTYPQPCGFAETLGTWNLVGCSIKTQSHVGMNILLRNPFGGHI